MIGMCAYFAVSYVAVGIAWAVVRARLRGRRGVKLAAGAALLLLPLLPYAVVAAQTAAYGDSMRADVRQALLDTGMSYGRFGRMRVLFITPSQAQVLAEEPCSAGTEGTIVFLKRSARHWKFVDYDTAWSDCGSAEGNTFPPYPEAREF